MEQDGNKLNFESFDNRGVKRYLLYASLLVVSLLGTDLTDFSLSIWVLDQPGSSVSSYSLIWFFEAMPKALLGLVVGGFVDRWDKKKILIFGQLVMGMGSLALIVLHFFDELMPWHIMAIAGIGSVCTIFIYSAFFVMAQVLVPKSKLPKVQGTVAMMYSLVEIGIPILAPVLYKLIGIGNIFIIDVVTFCVPLVSFMILNFEAMPKTNEQISLTKDFKLVIDFMRERRGLIFLFIFTFCCAFLFGLVQVMFVPLILDFANEYILGVIMSVIAAGSLVGGGIMGN